MNGSFRVGNLFGIPFYINVSWFLVLALVTFNYGNSLALTFPELGVGVSFFWGLITALLLFSSVLAHELGHSFVALRQGIDVKSITLFLFGGLASLERESKTPAEAFWVAIAGPLVSLGLFGVFFGAGILTGNIGPLAAILGLLAYINLALALFNLIPGLPLDGGNILKAAVWKITNNPYKGVVFASRVGQIFGWLGIVSGVFPLFIGGTLNIWNALIGLFILQNAGRSAQYAEVQDRLSQFTAADAVSPDSPIVPETLSLREFANEYVIGQETWRRFLVVNAERQLVGGIDIEDMKTIPTSDWPNVEVKQLVKPIENSTIVAAQQSLLEVVSLLEQKQITELPVIGENGVLLGLAEKTAIFNLLQQPKETTAA